MINFSEITEQKITEEYERLSQDLKDVLSSVKTSTAIESIATKYRLSEEKTTMLIQLVGLVILGFASFENMKEEMKETIDINLPIIPLIADEVRQKIFLPVMNSLQKVITDPFSPVPQIMKPTVPTSPKPIIPIPQNDRYREPTMGEPAPTLKVGAPTPVERGVGEIIDLRKTPPAVSKVEPPSPRPAPPLTFTKLVELPKPMPLIEAEPHRILPPTPTLKVGAPTSPSANVGAEKPTADLPKPQFILRPPGLVPTDFPRDVLDLRKDKGEF